MRSPRKPERIRRLTRFARRAGDGRSRRLLTLLTLLTTALTLASLSTLMTAGPAAAQPPLPAPGVTMSATARSATEVYVAYTSTLRDVILRNVATSPQTTIALVGRLVGGPALVVAPAGYFASRPTLVVFGRGTDNRLWWNHETANGWTGWQPVGGYLTSKPAAIAAQHGTAGPLVVFVRGTDGQVWSRIWSSTGWYNWSSSGGRLLAGTAPVAAYDSDGNLVVAAVGLDRRIWVHGSYYPAGWTSFGGQTTTDPGITTVAEHSAVIFVRGIDDALWRKGTTLYAPNLNGPWHSLGGVLTSGIAATTVPGGKTYVVALGTDNQIWMRSGVWPALDVWTRP